MYSVIFDRSSKQITKMGKKYVSIAQVDPKTLINMSLNDFIKKASKKASQNMSSYTVDTVNTRDSH